MTIQFMTRRTLIHSGMALVGTSTVPTLISCNCDAQCVSNLISATIMLIDVGVQIYEELNGRIIWDNRSDDIRRIQTLVCLVRGEDGNCMDSKEYIVNVEPGRNPYDFSGFEVEQPGWYYFVMQFLQKEEESDEFNVEG